MEKVLFNESEVQLSDGSSFKVYHNLTEWELEAALVNWQVRTDQFTASSFCGYINSKRLKGLSDHYCYTEDQWKQLNK
jgi:hypothetical protein